MLSGKIKIAKAGLQLLNLNSLVSVKTVNTKQCLPLTFLFEGYWPHNSFVFFLYLSNTTEVVQMADVLNSNHKSDLVIQFCHWKNRTMN